MGPDRRIAEFIAQNRRTYTREAITQQLIDAGYSREAIQATWAALEAPDPDSTPDTGFWGRFWWMLIGVNLVVLLGVGVLTGLLFNLEQGAPLLGALAVVLAIGALISWGIVAAVGPDKMGRTGSTTVGITIPLVMALLIGGGCYALIGSIGPPPRTGTLELDAGELSGSGSATCYVGQAGGGFSVFGQITGNPLVSVDVNTFPMDGGPPTDEVQNVSIFVEDERGTHYGPVAGETELTSNVDGGGLTGTVSFSNLRSDAAGEPFEGEAPEPISGSITWSCD
jgi:hypothetical protein